MHTHHGSTIGMIEFTAILFGLYLLITCVYVLLTTARAERWSVLKWSLALGVSVFAAHIVAWLAPSHRINFVPWWLYYPAVFLLFGGLGFVGCMAVASFIKTPPRPIVALKWGSALLAGFCVMRYGLMSRLAVAIGLWLGVIMIGVCAALILTTAAEVTRAAWYARAASKQKREETAAEQADSSLRSE